MGDGGKDTDSSSRRRPLAGGGQHPCSPGAARGLLSSAAPGSGRTALLGLCAVSWVEEGVRGPCDGAEGSARPEGMAVRLALAALCLATNRADGQVRPGEAVPGGGIALVRCQFLPGLSEHSLMVNHPFEEHRLSVRLSPHIRKVSRGGGGG
jgi:hypothetical protein